MGKRAYVVAASLLLLLAGCTPNPDDADPDGRILAALTSIEAAVPAGATDRSAREVEAHWDSCDGRSETAGWTDIGVYLSFRSSVATETMRLAVGSALANAGWSDDGSEPSPLGPTQRWRRTLADGTAARAVLAPSTQDGSAIVWQLSAVAPPHGPHVSGC
jgi:hypothetical protein